MTNKAPESPANPATNSLEVAASTPDRPVDVWGYLMSLRRYWVPALIAAVVVGGVLGFRELNAKPAATATSYVSLVPAPVTTVTEATQQTTAVPMLMRSYVSLASSPGVAAAAATALGHYTGAQVSSLVTVSSPNSSLLVTFAATSADSADAARIANAMAAAFVAQMPTLSSNAQPTLKLVSANVIKATAVPASATSTVMGLAIAAVAAVIAALLVAAIAELLHGRRRRRPAQG